MKKLKNYIKAVAGIFIGFLIMIKCNTLSKKERVIEKFDYKGYFENPQEQALAAAMVNNDIP